MQASFSFNDIKHLVLSQEVEPLAHAFSRLDHAQKQDMLRTKSENGKTLLSLSIDMSDWDMATWLVEQGAPVDHAASRQLWGKVAWNLGAGISKLDFDILHVERAQCWAHRLLGAGVGREDLIGRCWGPVHLALASSPKGQPATVALQLMESLHASGYGVDDGDEIKETPLLVALWHRKEDVVAWLLEHGANVQAKTISGCDVLDMLFREEAAAGDVGRMVSCLVLLQKAGIDIRTQSQRFMDTQALERISLSHADRIAVLREAFSIVDATKLHQEVAPSGGFRSVRF